MTLIYPGGGNCDPNEEPCVGPDCIDPGVGDPEDPIGGECLINCGGPTICTGPCCVDNQCICPDCSYGEEGDWHVYWMCDVNNVPVNLGEVIVLNPSSPSSNTMEVLESQNKHFGDSDLGFEQLGLNKIQIGDTFQKVDSNDYIIVGEDGAAFTTIYPCFTYLGKKFADSPGQAVTNGATYTEVPWTNGSTYNYSKNGEPCDCTTAPPPPLPETGCQDPAACNYNSEATIHDEDSCCYDGGCTDEAAVNYNPNICCDNGTCCYIPGCTDPNATNYDSTACFDDGSCCLSGGCTDSTAFNYNALACEDDGSCCYTAGCTDATATNYDPLACYDDGSCEYCTSTETNSCEINGATNMNEYWNLQNMHSDAHLQWFIDPNNYQIPFGNRYFEIDADDSPCGEGEGGGPKDGGEGGGASGTDNPCAGPNSGHYMLITSYEVSVDLQGSTSSGTTQSQVVTSWSDAITFLNSPAAANNPIFNENMDWATVQQWLGEVFQGWNISMVDYECCECTGGSSCGCTDVLAANHDPGSTFDDGSCIYESWDCDPVDGCYNLGTSLGQYSSLTACQNACDGGGTDVAISFDCTENGCVDPFTGNGAFASLIACQTACNVVVYGCTDDRALNYDPLVTTNNDLCEWEVPLYCMYNLDTSVLTTPTWIYTNSNANTVYDWVTHLNDTHSVEFGGALVGTSFDVGAGTQYAEEMCATYLGKFIHTGDPNSASVSIVPMRASYGLPIAGAVLNQTGCVACADDPLLPDSTD